MIIGLCGTHGTGKSTILQGVKEHFCVNESQLSRAAQASLGWDKLSKAQESIDNMWQLQEAILAAMYDRDQDILKSNVITLVERTPADVWAYTLMWCKRLNINTRTDAQALNYKGRCISMAQRYSKYLFVPISDAVPFQVDPNRADLEGRQFVNDAIYSFLLAGLYPFNKFTYTSKQDRINEALTCLEVIKLSERK